jgi:hypothetical protein
VEEVVEGTDVSALETTIDPPTDLLEAALIASVVGDLRIIETSPTVDVPSDYELIGRQVRVETPISSFSNPHEIVLTIDDSILAGASFPRDLAVLRNGTAMEPCRTPARRASPNPCLSRRESPDVNHTAFTIYSSRGGNYNLAVPLDVTTTTTTSLPGATTSSTSTSTSSSSSTVSSSAPSTTVTSTSTSSSSVPTSTLPRSRRRRLVGGTKLLLRDHPTRAAARRLAFRSDDVTELEFGEGSAADPTPLLAEGGTLRVTAIGGDWFETVYPLDAEDWIPLSAKNPRAGLRYRNPGGPITKIVFQTNGKLVVAGKGALLGQTLGTEPDLVEIELTIGTYSYCLEFGGSEQQFASRRKLLRRNALRPVACLNADGTPVED